MVCLFSGGPLLLREGWRGESEPYQTRFKVSSTLPLPNMLSVSLVSSLLGGTRLGWVASFMCIV
jgi:hypothetical protein